MREFLAPSPLTPVRPVVDLTYRCPQVTAAMAAPAGNGVDGNQVHHGHLAGDGEYDRHSMLGHLDENDEDIPLLYFHSIPEAFVST